MNIFKSENLKFPIEYDANCHFFQDYMIMDNEKYPYEELAIIIYNANSKYVNGIRINHFIQLTLYFINKDYIPFPMNSSQLSGIAQFNYEKGLIPTNLKLGKIIEFINSYLQTKTFEKRLKRHLNSLEMYNKFSFGEGLPVFFNNGDLFNNGIFEGNLKVMNDNDKIIDGEKYGGYKNKVSNPYTYGFEKGTKFFGLIADKVEFGNTINRDIMYVLFNNLYKRGKMNKF